MTYTFKTLTDSDGITYQEVTYDEYLKAKNKQRIIQHLEARYFIEVDKEKQGVKE